jgi:chitin synthase
MFYKHLFTDLSIPVVELTDEINRIVAFVPVYKETLQQLSRTVDSILSNNIAPHYVLTCVVSDGNNNYKDIMDNIIVSKTGYYKNWKGEDVSVNVYYGTRSGRHTVLIEKDKNFGKKDSIILANNIFNQSPFNIDRFTTHLKQEITKELLGVFGVNEFDYMFATDADTTIEDHTIVCLIDSVVKRNAMASCGIVNVDLSEQGSSWFWNNLQNFQYLYGQYTRRSTEDLFGQVLCLPGCVSLFRLNNNDDARILYSQIPDEDDLVISSVQYVGTDRRYTGCLLYTNPNTKIVMDTRCNAYTTPPQSVEAYTFQRRRWCQNTYFNTMINIIAPNINVILRFFCLIDYLRLTLVYFRLFNTLFFIYLLASHFHPTNILELVPYLVILTYPTLTFFIYCLVNKHLRQQWFNLFFSYLLNKLFILLSNVFIFTTMLLNIGSESWSQSE